MKTYRLLGILILATASVVGLCSCADDDPGAVLQKAAEKSMKTKSIVQSFEIGIDIRHPQDGQNDDIGTSIGIRGQASHDFDSVKSKAEFVITAFEKDFEGEYFSDSTKSVMKIPGLSPKYILAEREKAMEGDYASERDAAAGIMKTLAKSAPAEAISMSSIKGDDGKDLTAVEIFMKDEQLQEFLNIAAESMLKLPSFRRSMEDSIRRQFEQAGEFYGGEDVQEKLEKMESDFYGVMRDSGIRISKFDITYNIDKSYNIKGTLALCEMTVEPDQGEIGASTVGITVKTNTVSTGTRLEIEVPNPQKWEYIKADDIYKVLNP